MKRINFENFKMAIFTKPTLPKFLFAIFLSIASWFVASIFFEKGLFVLGCVYTFMPLGYIDDQLDRIGFYKKVKSKRVKLIVDSD